MYQRLSAVCFSIYWLILSDRGLGFAGGGDLANIKG